MRRDLHRHPELAFREERTSSVAADAVEALGFDVRRGVGRTGVVADLVHGDGPTVALRADMDALPIEEEADHDYASTNAGIMHACGHDAHVTGLVGAARLLAGLRERGELPAGTVRLLFQPAEEAPDEEGVSGAPRMIEDGALDGVCAVAGLHVGAHLPSGTLFVSPGPVMAGSSEIDIEVRGRSAHAALPQDGVDALALAALGLVGVQQAVARRIDPMKAGVVTFGTISGGTAKNVLAERVRLGGTLRYFDPEVRTRLVAGVEGAFGMLREMGAEVRVRIATGYPPVVNDDTAAAWLRDSGLACLPDGQVQPMEPMMGAEDFSFYAREVPAAFAWLGAAPEGDARDHHHPRFDIDENVLPQSAAILAGWAVRALEESR